MQWVKLDEIGLKIDEYLENADFILTDADGVIQTADMIKADFKTFYYKKMIEKCYKIEENKFAENNVDFDLCLTDDDEVVFKIAQTKQIKAISLCQYFYVDDN